MTAASTSEVAQLVDFMQRDLESRTSNMVGFLSKRARLMIRYSLDLLGSYLSVLKDPRTERGIDLNSFLEDISASLEEFKEREKNIRRKHFYYDEESEILDPTLAQNPVFNLSDISHLHAILSVFKPAHIEVKMTSSNSISLNVPTTKKPTYSSKPSVSNPRAENLLRDVIEPYQRSPRDPADLRTYYVPKQELPNRSRSGSREQDRKNDSPYLQSLRPRVDENPVLAKVPVYSNTAAHSQPTKDYRDSRDQIGRDAANYARPAREPIPEYTEVATKDFEDEYLDDRPLYSSSDRYGNILVPSSEDRTAFSNKKGFLRSDLITNPELSFSEKKPQFSSSKNSADYGADIAAQRQDPRDFTSLRGRSRSPPDEPRREQYSSRQGPERDEPEDHPRESSDPRSVKSTKSAVGAVLVFQSKPKEPIRGHKQQQPLVVGPWDGFQKVKYDNGSFEGYMKEGKRHGKGVYVWQDGSRYEGDWFKDLKQGKGVFRWDNGDVYEGSFYADHREGKGKKIYANHDVYEGTWAKGKKHGKGNFYSANGDHYSGEFKNNKREGFGVKVWSGGARYEGTWKADRMHGEGTFTWPQGDWYKGDYVMGMRTGKGTKVWASGTQYQVNFF